MTHVRRLGPVKLGIVLVTLVALVLLGWGGVATVSADNDRRVKLDRGTPYIVAAGRSPIPRPGERITEPLPYSRLVAKERVKAPDSPVAWSSAHRYVGQRITVEGTIVNTYNHEGNICFLNFHEDWRGKFYIPVFKEVFADLPGSPEKYYLNKTVRVTGKVTEHRGRPNIEVRNIRMIEVVD